jgi:hypothetical protein
MRVLVKIVINGAGDKNERDHRDEQYDGLTQGQPVARIFFCASSRHWVSQKESSSPARVGHFEK